MTSTAAPGAVAMTPASESAGSSGGSSGLTLPFDFDKAMLQFSKYLMRVRPRTAEELFATSVSYFASSASLTVYPNFWTHCGSPSGCNAVLRSQSFLPVGVNSYTCGHCGVSRTAKEVAEATSEEGHVFYCTRCRWYRCVRCRYQTCAKCDERMELRAVHSKDPDDVQWCDKCQIKCRNYFHCEACQVTTCLRDYNPLEYALPYVITKFPVWEGKLIQKYRRNNEWESEKEQPLKAIFRVISPRQCRVRLTYSTSSTSGGGGSTSASGVGSTTSVICDGEVHADQAEITWAESVRRKVWKGKLEGTKISGSFDDEYCVERWWLIRQE